MNLPQIWNLREGSLQKARTIGIELTYLTMESEMSYFWHRYLYRIVSAGFVVVICMACGQKMLDKPAEQNTSVPFKLVIANSGGFSGLSTGFTLDQTGRIEHWQHFPAGKDSILWSRQTKSSSILTFKKQLEDLGVLNRRIQQSGNMTTQVTYTLPDTTYTWYWSQATKTELSGWVREVESFCKQMQQQ
jgi:hypothetical protein